MLRVYYHVSCNKTDLSRCGNRRLYGRISSNVEKIFFLRRGAPLSITSDNSPTFALGDSILSECFQNAKDDPMVSKKISSRQIDWIYITPYAPWQGGAYERLIEIGSSQVYRESSSNARRFTHLTSGNWGNAEHKTPFICRVRNWEGSHLETHRFLAKRVRSTATARYERGGRQWSYVLDFVDQAAFQTRLQVIQAINSSSQPTEKFWQLWQSKYLKSLQE